MAESEKPGTWETWKAKHLRWRRQLTLWDAFIVFLLIGLVLIRLSGAHEWTFWSKDNRETIRDLALIIAAIVGVPFVIWREYSTHRAAKAAERQAETAARQAETAAERHEKQTEADRERRITDSFTKAVELLGKSELEVRLGAIYALERIARESKRDHWPIMETLTAYVRTKSPAQVKAQDASQSSQGHSSDKAVSAYAVAAAEGTTGAEQGTAQTSLTELAVDIQAVLTVLTRRTLKHEEKNQRINLSRANLSGADLSQADLSQADLSGADLNKANLNEANLNEANLSGASLREANLSRAKLSWAYLSRAYLGWANLSRAYLGRANLSQAYLGWANLSEAYLGQANLGGAILSEADLSQADLSRADLSRAILREADLREADLDGAKFCQTIMPDSTVNNSDCLPEEVPPNQSETPPSPN